MFDAYGSYNPGFLLMGSMISLSGLMLYPVPYIQNLLDKKVRYFKDFEDVQIKIWCRTNKIAKECSIYDFQVGGVCPAGLSLRKTCQVKYNQNFTKRNQSSPFPNTSRNKLLYPLNNSTSKLYSSEIISGPTDRGNGITRGSTSPVERVNIRSELELGVLDIYTCNISYWYK